MHSGGYTHASQQTPANASPPLPIFSSSPGSKRFYAKCDAVRTRRLQEQSTSDNADDTGSGARDAEVGRHRGAGRCAGGSGRAAVRGLRNFDAEVGGGRGVDGAVLGRDGRSRDASGGGGSSASSPARPRCVGAPWAVRPARPGGSRASASSPPLRPGAVGPLAGAGARPWAPTVVRSAVAEWAPAAVASPPWWATRSAKWRAAPIADDARPCGVCGPGGRPCSAAGCCGPRRLRLRGHGGACIGAELCNGLVGVFFLGGAT